MEIVADESVDFNIVLALRQSGVDVFAIAESSPSIIDENVLEIAVRKGIPLLTEDKDFGELVYRLQLPHCGVLLLRVLNMPTEIKCILISKIINEHIESIKNAFCVFDGFNMRVRKR
jgi:predicted nuclease of predicted toxin-antitoxin system